MLRSMYAGISGMKNFQTKLDVIGNNIANVNTSGFKKGRVTFQDMMSQTTSGAQGPTATRGGVNPAQVGLGSQLGSIDNIHTQGFRQTTNNPLDFAIEGDGMFVVANNLNFNGDLINLNNSSVAYTRAGNFYLDDFGNIVNPQGYYLVGHGVETYPGLRIEDADGNIIEVKIDGEDTIATMIKDGIKIELDVDYQSESITVSDPNDNDWSFTVNPNTQEVTDYPGGVNSITQSAISIDEPVPGNFSIINIPDGAQSFSVQTDGVVNYVDANGQTRIAGQVVLANFSNPAGLEKAGSNLFLNSPNAGYNGMAAPESDGTGSIVSGALEMSNVDLSEEFTEMITAQRGFQANTRIITTSDEILQELVNLKR